MDPGAVWWESWPPGEAAKLRNPYRPALWWPLIGFSSFSCWRPSLLIWLLSLPSKECRNGVCIRADILKGRSFTTPLFPCCAYSILDLQKDRYFEFLSGKYWNSTAKRNCDSSDEDEGITLESLGGVFIATLFGLVLAMITLGIEILYEKKAKRNVIKVKGDKKEKNKMALANTFFNDDKLFTREFGHDFPKKPSTIIGPSKPDISFIKVFPRDQLY
ncbi:unnamed protein product [Nesidiocoris tenuis]|uniref:Ionotropic glutamate receptor C-terminal domain-containing protein n=1 Tax=Nesidiocoris tenuis TaxID=355587 RepID=A0A6H5GVK5_9HEMI|nr:unnamed protein product [Nesidiocoris tenuis]